MLLLVKMYLMIRRRGNDLVTEKNEKGGFAYLAVASRARHDKGLLSRKGILARREEIYMSGGRWRVKPAMTTHWWFNKEIPARRPESAKSDGNDLRNRLSTISFRVF